MASAADPPAVSDVSESPVEGRATDAAPAYREIRYEHSRNSRRCWSTSASRCWCPPTRRARSSSSGSGKGELTLSFHNFERAMGLAVRPDAHRRRRPHPGLVPAQRPGHRARLEPAGRHDACFLTRSSHFTGEIQAHELAWAGDELWLVNTAFSCLCTLDEPAQLRAALAAAVHHGPGGRGPLPPQRPGDGRRAGRST